MGPHWWLLARTGASRRRSRAPVEGEPCGAQWHPVDPEDWSTGRPAEPLSVVSNLPPAISAVGPSEDPDTATQDGHPLRRYQRRWRVERLFAWFQNFRRIVVRYERLAENFLGMLHLASCLILLRGL